MKKIALLIFLSGCGPTREEREAQQREDDKAHAIKKTDHYDYNLFEETIDSCEYIILDGYHSGCIIHKPNCRNRFHSAAGH